MGTTEAESSKSSRLNFLEKIKAEIESEKPQKCVNDKATFSKDSEKSRVKTKKKNNEKSSIKSESKNIKMENSEEHAIVSKLNHEKTNNKSDKKTFAKAELKRVESLKERNTFLGNQQKVIKMALESARNMSKPSSNKIKFEDSDEESQKESSKEGGKKRKLFDDSDGSDNDDSELFDANKSKFKLIRTKFSALDERFRMDSKFFDDEDENEAQEKSDMDEERNKVLEIADSIMGKIPSAKFKKIPAKEVQPVLATRFDPLEKKHKSLIVKRDEDIEEPVKKNVKLTKFKVTQDRFYDVSDKLKDQFKNTSSEGFSFLGLFGGEVKDEEKTKNIVNDNILPEEKSKKIKQLENPLLSGIPNFFNVDDESDVEEEKSKDQPKKVSKSKKISMYETLFIHMSDSRVEEALEFFSSPQESNLAHVVISSKLRKIVKKKHQRNLAKSKLFKTKLGMKRKFKKRINNKKGSSK